MANVQLKPEMLDALFVLAQQNARSAGGATLFIGTNSDKGKSFGIFAPFVDAAKFALETTKFLLKAMVTFDPENPQKLSFLLLTAQAAYFIPEHDYKNLYLDENLKILREQGCTVIFVNTIRFQKADYSIEG